MHTAGQAGSAQRHSDVLVVGADVHSADSRSLALRGYGLRTHVAYDERSAVSVAQAQPLDAALIDVAAMREAGMATARSLRTHCGPRLRLVACAEHPAEERPGLLAAGFDGLVGRHARSIELVEALSPETYVLVARSVAASVHQIEIQIDIAHSLLGQVTLAADPGPAVRTREFLASRIAVLREMVEALPLAEEERQRLSARIAEVAQRLAPPKR